MDDQLTLSEMLAQCMAERICVGIETMQFPDKSMVQVVLKRTTDKGIETVVGVVDGDLLAQSRIDPVVREIAVKRRELMEKTDAGK